MNIPTQAEMEALDAPMKDLTLEQRHFALNYLYGTLLAHAPDWLQRAIAGAVAEAKERA